MFKFNFTCEVICADGVLRKLQQHGYFESRDLLRAFLKQWSGCSGPNGGTYEYFESESDLAHNAKCRPLPRDYHYPDGARLRTSLAEWNNESVDYRRYGNRYNAYAPYGAYKVKPEYSYAY